MCFNFEFASIFAMCRLQFFFSVRSTFTLRRVPAVACTFILRSNKCDGPFNFFIPCWTEMDVFNIYAWIIVFIVCLVDRFLDFSGCFASSNCYIFDALHLTIKPETKRSQDIQIHRRCETSIRFRKIRRKNLYQAEQTATTKTNLFVAAILAPLQPLIF